MCGIGPERQIPKVHIHYWRSNVRSWKRNSCFFCCKVITVTGLKVTCIKIDPYVNYDAGTMNPTAHGEVFVTDDGGECDMDMGNYERFLNTPMTKGTILLLGGFILML